MQLSCPSAKHTSYQGVLPVCQFEIHWSNGFQVRVWKPHLDRRTDGRRTRQSNRRIGYTQPAQKVLSEEKLKSWIKTKLDFPVDILDKSATC